jgi:phospholipid/cholesterol/gamma-HCH transport system permease protein
LIDVDPDYVSSQPTPKRIGLGSFGRNLLRFTLALKALGAFSLITAGVLTTRFNAASRLIHPLIAAQLFRAGVRLLPITSFLACALGFVIIGQTVALLSRVGAQQFTGTIMVTVVFRELGPILTAMVMLARVGTATVIELGTNRALGEVEALEALGIDPIHYLVVPRLLAMTVGVFSLSVYLILTALFSGYVFAFLQDIPLTPGDYIGQLAQALTWQDFVLLGLKTSFFGFLIGMVTCYQGLAQPLRLEDVSGATIQAVMYPPNEPPVRNAWSASTAGRSATASTPARTSRAVAGPQSSAMAAAKSAP